MEHVGYKNYRTYMEVASRCLKPGGIAFVHTIGGNESATSTDPFTHDYIFPNGMLPSIAQLGQSHGEPLRHGRLAQHRPALRPDADGLVRELRAGLARAEGAYDERFRRMWRYYLLGSAGGFRSRGKQVWQIVMTRHGTRSPTAGSAGRPDDPNRRHHRRRRAGRFGVRSAAEAARRRLRGPRPAAIPARQAVRRVDHAGSGEGPGTRAGRIPVQLHHVPRPDRVRPDGSRSRSNHQHAIRRVEFDHWLLRRSGAPVYEHTVRSIVRSGSGYVIDGAFAGQYLVGAGGTYCPVYRALFKADHPRAARRADRRSGGGVRLSARRAATAGCGSGRACPATRGIVPKAGGYVNVGVGAWAEALSRRRREPEDALGAVRRKARPGGPRAPARATAPRGHSYYLRQRLGAVRSGNAFIAGDAAGLATLDMGEGIGPAIRSGVLAADAIASGGEYSAALHPAILTGDDRGKGAPGGLPSEQETNLASRGRERTRPPRWRQSDRNRQPRGCRAVDEASGRRRDRRPAPARRTPA